jgi:hypothetical protein
MPEAALEGAQERLHPDRPTRSQGASTKVKRSLPHLFGRAQQSKDAVVRTCVPHRLFGADRPKVSSLPQNKYVEKIK